MSDPAAEDLFAENQRLRARNLALETELAELRAYAPASNGNMPVVDAQLASDIQRLHSLIDSQTTYVIRVDLHGNYTYVNRAFCQTFGLASSDLLGTSSIEMVIPEDREQLAVSANACLESSGTPVKVILRKALPSGALRWAQWELFAIADTHGVPNEIQCVGFDITDRLIAEEGLRRSKAEIDELYALAQEEVAARKRAEEALRLQAEELQLALDAARMGAWRLDLVTSEATISENLVRLYAIPSHGPAANYQRLRELIYAEDRPRIAEAVKNAIAGGKEFEIEFRILDGNGEERWTVARGRVFVDAQNQPLYITGIARDINPRKQAEARMRRSEARLTAVFDAGLDIVSLVRSDGTYEYVNSMVEKVLGYTPDEVMQFGVTDLMHPDDRAAVEAQLIGLLSRPGESIRVEFQVLHKDGTWRWIENKISNFVDHASVGAFVSIGHDITERKAAEAALRELNETLEQRVHERTQALEREIAERVLIEESLQAQQNFARQIMETMGQGLVVYNGEGIVEYANLCVAEMFGYPQETIIGRPMISFIDPEDVPLVVANQARRANNEGDSYEIRIRTIDGKSKYVLVAATPRISEGKRGGAIAVITDLTERRAAEEALRLREEQFRLLADNTTDIISQHTLDEKLLYVTPSVYAILGYAPEELLRGEADFEVHPDDLSALSATAQDLLLEGNTPRVELRMRRKDGTYVWIEAISRLVRNPVTGQPSTVVRSARDVTARRLAEEALRLRGAELADLNAELAKASRLKDEFLANMSHELRTPLTGVLGLTEGLLNLVYGPLNERQVRALHLIDESGRHLLSLINDILDLSKVEAGKMELAVAAVRVADICAASLNMVRHLAQKRRQRLNFVLAYPDSLVRADPRRLKQILVNLLSNAVKFTPEEGELGLIVEVKPGDGMITFVVWDRGIGIAQEQQGRLFQPFMQLDGGLARQYTGTGLGLALVRRLTELQGGTVDLESAPGAGSRFTIRLPSAE